MNDTDQVFVFFPLNIFMAYLGKKNKTKPNKKTNIEPVQYYL